MSDTDGFLSIGFHVGATATVHVVNGDPDSTGEPLIVISDETDRWVTISSGIRNEGSRAHVDFARQLAVSASKYLAAVERFAGEHGTDPEESPDATPGVDGEDRS